MTGTEPKRLTKRRVETRRRLHQAALEEFAERGFGVVTVEQVCAAAGFTRGAFYSNFDSLDELFLSMWEDRSQVLLADLHEVLAAVDLGAVRSVRQVVELMDQAVGLDDAWYRVTAEFSAHALRDPALRRVMAAREEAIVATLASVLQSFLRGAGRRAEDPQALALALVAVHDGTSLQCLTEPDDPRPRLRRLDLFERVVFAYTAESTGDSE
ncbi:TetR/AcrR family transcriptional regulator [Lentzea sp. JNUCC 0626]|uniref:TetR/AcrR family transcriptional regulator n=1 Tax=Lentzea sp. JNUCC 0626 TaxID=3367513 RepID=UPI003747D549